MQLSSPLLDGTGSAGTAGQVLTSTGAGTVPTYQTVSSGPFTTVTTRQLVLTGNISAPAWTGSGLRVTAANSTFTDTTSTGSVPVAHTDHYYGGTIAAASSVTFDQYNGAYFSNPVPGANVTITKRFALAADSLYVGGFQVQQDGGIYGGYAYTGFRIYLNNVTLNGTVPIVNGGTGATTARGSRDALGLLTLVTLGTTGAVTVDLATRARFLLAPTGNVTLSLANDADGVSWLVFVRASAFGVTWPTGVKWTGTGAAPTLPTVAGRVMMVAVTRLAAGEYVGTASPEAF